MTIPNEMVGLGDKKEHEPVESIEKNMEMTQHEVSKKDKNSQMVLSQTEKSNSDLRTTTLENLALAAGVYVEQL